MAFFSFYFAICLFGLLVRGHYRVPLSCIIHEPLDKDEGTFKSLIADRIDCKCHYTNFLLHKTLMDDHNETIMNNSLSINNDEERTIKPIVLVR